MKNFAMMLTLALLLPACGRQEQSKPPAAPPATLITVTQAATVKLEILEQTIGSLESLVDPGMGAEVPARVVKVLAHAGQDVKKGQLIAVLDATDYALQKREAQAEAARVQALLANQGRVVERNERLVQKNFISQNALDDATSQQQALREELAAVQARIAAIDYNSGKTQVRSPIDGRVEKQIVSPGDFVKQGDPLFQLIGTQKLRAHLPFPESVAAKLRPGQTVRLATPTVPGQVYTTVIKEIKPLVGSNRAVDVIADVEGQAGWQGGASVDGTVVLGELAQAVVVPEASVVLRPAGEVVYVIKDKLAAQRVVRTGQRQQGVVEILEGLNAGETVALDGAGYLTDKAPVNVQSADAAR